MTSPAFAAGIAACAFILPESAADTMKYAVGVDAAWSHLDG